MIHLSILTSVDFEVAMLNPFYISVSWKQALKPLVSDVCLLSRFFILSLVCYVGWTVKLLYWVDYESPFLLRIHVFHPL